MTATSMTTLKTRPAHREPRSSGRSEAASFNGAPACGDHVRERTQESAAKKSRRGPRQASEYAPKQPAHPLSTEEEYDLAARIKAGDQVAREALIMANLGLIANIARHYYSHGATHDDLIQEGSRGLIQAVERYDPETHNTRFATYARYWIRNKIQRAIAANFSLVRLPDYMFRLNARAHRVGVEPRTEKGAAPDDRGSAAVGSRLEISHRQLHLLKHSMISRSTYYGVDDYGEETSLEEILADSHYPEHDLETAEELDELHEAIDRLTPVEAWLIRRRFGLDDPCAYPPSAVTLEEKGRERGGRLAGVDVHQARPCAGGLHSSHTRCRARCTGEATQFLAV